MLVNIKNDKQILIFLIFLCILNINIHKSLITSQNSNKENKENNFISSKETLTEEVDNQNEILFHLHNDNRYNQIITKKTWNRDLAIAYRDWAGLGYLSKESAESQLSEIAKGENKKKSKIGFFLRKFIEIYNWEHITTFTGGEDINNFSYSIFRNVNLRKIILTFSGTKGPTQLISEYIHSNFVAFSRIENSENKNLTKMKIMEYMNSLYNVIYEQLYKDVSLALNKDNKNDNNMQIIFTGHSLGGAMASIAALDLVENKIIDSKMEKENSNDNNDKEILTPVLITYGQPRTGNFVFANEIKKKIPIIFRHVNNYDVIVGMPSCYKDNKDFCVNEYKKKNLDENFSDYENIEINEDLLKGNNFGWHFDGLIINTNDENSIECFNVSEISESSTKNEKGEFECGVQSGVMTAFHSHYYGFKVSDFYKPEIFRYNLEEINCSLSDLIEIFGGLPPIFNKTKNFLGNFIKNYSLEDNLGFKFIIDPDHKKEGKYYINNNNNSTIKGLIDDKTDFVMNKICYYFLKLFRNYGQIK
jgi:hypothetical protein